jgi:hypothetical protein
MSKNIITRFRTVPKDLFRFQGTNSTTLRNFEDQVKKGSTSFDFKFQTDGKIHPASEDTFTGPNGMSLRPLGSALYSLVTKKALPTKAVFCIPKDTPIPPELVIIHEHSDHFSLQTTTPVTYKELMKNMTKFLAPHKIPFEEVHERLVQYKKEHPDEFSD